MVTEVRSLLVSADMDAASYIAESRRKVAADEAMAASSRQVGEAQQQQDQKISTSGNALEKLSRQYVDGYGSAVRMRNAVNELARGVASGNVSLGQASSIMEGISRKYGMMFDASSVAAKGQVELAKVIETVNASLAKQSSALAANEIAQARRQQAGQNFTSDFNQRVGVNGYGTSARDSASVFEEAARQTELYEQKVAALRTAIDPVGASQIALNKQLDEYRMLLANAAISAEEFAKAETLARTRHDEFAASMKKGGQASTFGAQMVGYQAQDIITQAVGGASIGTIAMQQGPQLAMGLAGTGGATGAIKTLGAGLATLVSMESLVAIGLTAAAAAAIQYGVKAYNSVKTTTDVLKDHEKAIKGVGDAYGGTLKNLKAYSDESHAFAQLQNNSNITQLQARLRLSQSELLQQFGAERSGRSAGRFGQATTGTEFTANSEFKPFEGAFKQLQADIRAGKDGMDQFYRSVLSIAQGSPELQKLADKIIALTADTDQLTRATNAAKEAQRQMLNAEDGRLDNIAGNREAGAYVRQRDRQNETQAARFAADQQAAMARTYAERLAAVEAQVRANAPADGDSGGGLQVRIAQARTAELNRQRKEQEDAARARRESLDQSLQDQQNEISLIGKTGGELAGLRKQYELISALKLEAARNGTQVDQREIDLIKQKTSELGALTDAYIKANMANDLKTQYRQLYRTSQDQQIASQLQNYGLPDNLASPEAAQIRNLLNAQQMKSDLTTFFTDFRTELVNNGGDLGKALMTSLQNAAMNQLNRIWDRLFEQLSNSIVNSIFGNGGTASATGYGGIGSVIGKAITGAVANDNNATGIAPVMPVTRAPLGGIPTTDVASYIAQAATARGIDPNIALQVAKSEGGLTSWNLQSGYFKNGVQEASFGPYQLYMNGGLGNAFMRQTGLDPRIAANGPAGVDFALDYAKQNGWGAWYGAAKSGIGKWDGIGANSATDAVNKLATSATGASSNVSQFGNGLNGATSGLSQIDGGLNRVSGSLSTAANGLGSFGNGLNTFSGQLANILKTGGAGTGGSWLDNLLGGVGKAVGGISPTSSLWSANTTLGSFLVNGFADGGFTGRFGEQEVAGIVHGGEYVFSKRATDRLGVGTLDALHRRARGYSDGGYVGTSAANANNPAPGSHVEINIINNSGSQVSQKSRQTANGKAIDVFIDDGVAEKIGRIGSNTDRALQSQYGLSRGLSRR